MILDWFPSKSKEGRSPSECHPYSTFPGMGWSLPLLSSSTPSPGRKNKWDVVLFRSLPESLSVAGFFSSDSKLKSPWATVLFTVLLLWRVTLTKAAYGRKHFIGRLFTTSDGWSLGSMVGRVAAGRHATGGRVENYLLVHGRQAVRLGLARAF